MSDANNNKSTVYIPPPDQSDHNNDESQNLSHLGFIANQQKVKEDVHPSETKVKSQATSTRGRVHNNEERVYRMENDESDIEELIVKDSLLNKIEECRRQLLMKGQTRVSSPELFTLKTPLKIVKAEYERIERELRLSYGASAARTVLLSVISAVETLNKSFDPLGLDLDGFSTTMQHATLDAEYTEVLKEMYERYGISLNTWGPEMRLLSLMGKSAIMFTMMKSMNGGNPAPQSLGGSGGSGGLAGNSVRGGNSNGPWGQSGVQSNVPPVPTQTESRLRPPRKDDIDASIQMLKQMQMRSALQKQQQEKEQNSESSVAVVEKPPVTRKPRGGGTGRGRGRGKSVAK